MNLLIFALAIFLGGMVIQLWLLHLTQTRIIWLRFLTLAASAGRFVLAWVDHNSSAFFHELAAFVDLCVGLLILLGWGIAWGIYKRNK